MSGGPAVVPLVADPTATTARRRRSHPTPPARLLDRAAAACYLGLSLRAVVGLDNAGYLRRVRIPPLTNGAAVRRVLYDVRDLDALIECWKDPPR